MVDYIKIIIVTVAIVLLIIGIVLGFIFSHNKKEKQLTYRDYLSQTFKSHNKTEHFTNSDGSIGSIQCIGKADNLITRNTLYNMSFLMKEKTFWNNAVTLKDGLTLVDKNNVNVTLDEYINVITTTYSAIYDLIVKLEASLGMDNINYIHLLFLLMNDNALNILIMGVFKMKNDKDTDISKLYASAVMMIIGSGMNQLLLALGNIDNDIIYYDKETDLVTLDTTKTSIPQYNFPKDTVIQKPAVDFYEFMMINLAYNIDTPTQIVRTQPFTALEEQFNSLKLILNKQNDCQSVLYTNIKYLSGYNFFNVA